MNRETHKKLTFEFPVDEYVHLKMACARQHISMKEFVTKSLLKTLNEYEDQLDVLTLQEELTEENIKKALPLDEAFKQLNWENI